MRRHILARVNNFCLFYSQPVFPNEQLYFGRGDGFRSAPRFNHGKEPHHS